MNYLNQAEAINVPLGNSPALEVVAEGPGLTYQWEKDGYIPQRKSPQALRFLCGQP